MRASAILYHLSACLACFLAYAIHDDTITPNRVTYTDQVLHLPLFGRVLSKTYSGLIPIPRGEIYYLFYEAQSPSQSYNGTDIPLIVWLNGGPGSSSLLGAFAENGPIIVDGQGRLTVNEFSWNIAYHYMIFDQPAGSGFSSVKEGSEYCSNEQDIAEDMAAVLEQFFELHPEYSANPIYLCGESYAGQYVPYIADYVRDTTKINIVGAAIANGWLLPSIQYESVIDLYSALGLINTAQKENAQFEMTKCIGLLIAGHSFDAWKTCEGMVEQLNWDAGKPWEYDLRRSTNEANVDVRDMFLAEYFGRPDVQRALHTEGRAWISIDGWGPRNGTTSDPVAFNPVAAALNSTYMADATEKLTNLLQRGMQVLVYSGNMDISSCGTLGTERLLQRLSWPHAKEFHSQPREVWRGVKQKPTGAVKPVAHEEVFGYVTTFAGLTFVTVINAGHLVPQTQPAAAKDMIDKWIAKEIKWDNNKDLTQYQSTAF
eukprot:Filipodium_phascolosomae@DN4993_c0_g1_i1.p1